ncbi:MAG TPA: hypothetical protein VHE60_08750 [Pyrinomonadaceae bacterium]|nr:hypothetical protein [Pyrinomonadaceae bacterium]
MSMTSDLKSTTTALLTVSLLLMGCNLSKLRPGGSPSSGNDNSSRSTTAFKPSGDARQDVRDAYKKLSSAYPYRLTETTSITGGQPSMPPGTRVSEFAAADRVHSKMGDFEYIQIGDKSYTNYGGKWVESGKPPKASESAMAKLIDAGLKDVQSAGTETVNGIRCAVYTSRFEYNFGDEPATGTSRIWIGLSDGLLHQVDSEGKVSSYSSKSHLVYEYNVDIKIEKPVP